MAEQEIVLKIIFLFIANIIISLLHLNQELKDKSND